jgi:hypothetical protein
MPLPSLLKSVFSFTAVGAAAALVHLLVFGFLKDHLQPEIANLIAFLVAFSVSFAGHRLLSFKDSITSIKQSLQRFALTSVAGFATNQLMFIVLFRAMQWTDWGALTIALGIAALQTFILSRWWAFKR